MHQLQPYERKTITSAQLRAARALLDLSAQEFAARAQLGVATVRRAERADALGNLTEANAARILETFDREGVEFIDQDGRQRGVRFKQ